MRIITNERAGFFVLGVMILGAFGFLQMFLIAESESVRSESEVTRPIELPFANRCSIDGCELFGDVSGDAALTDRPLWSASHETLRRKIELLENGRLYLLASGDYTAELDKREEVRGQLQDEQSMFLKCRHLPFSIYMRWNAGDVGREVIFIEGANDGRMIVHDGGWKARIPAFHLLPDCSLAMRDTRYPITHAGLLGLIDVMLAVHKKDIQEFTFDDCQCGHDAEFDGRKCLSFTTRYKSPEASPDYRKSVTLIDCEWNLPLHSEHFGWPSGANIGDENAVDSATLIEQYAFRQLKFHQKFSEADFHHANNEYHFR